MENRKFFRGSFNGFRRQDVLNYIDELRGEQQKELTAMQDQLSQMQQQREAEAEAIAEAFSLREQVAGFDSVRAEKAAVELENETLRGKVASCEQQIADLANKLEEANRSIAAMWEARRQLEQSMDVAKQFAEDMRVLGKELCENIEKHAAARFEGGELPQAAPAPAVAEKSGEMENWLF